MGKLIEEFAKIRFAADGRITDLSGNELTPSDVSLPVQAEMQRRDIHFARKAEQREHPAQGTVSNRANDKSSYIPNPISNIKDIGGKCSENGEDTSVLRQVLRQECDNLGEYNDEDLQDIPLEQRMHHGELVRKFRQFLFDNREPHHKKDVALAIGTLYQNRSYLKILEREKNKTFRYLYGGDRIQYLNSDWKASQVIFGEDDKLPSLGLKLPFSMEFYVDILKKSTMVCAGQKGAGKTHYALELADLNLGIMPIRFFFTELGSERIKDLIKADYPNLLEAAKRGGEDFELVNADLNDVDVLNSLDPDGITIYDYLQIRGGDRWWLDMQLKIREYAKKIGNGFLFLNMQLLRNRDVALGGEGTTFQSETYITLHEVERVGYSASGDKGFKVCRLDIRYARDWKPDTKVNPEAMSVDYRTGGQRGKLVMVEHSWGLTSEKLKKARLNEM